MDPTQLPGFLSPELLTWLEERGVAFIVAAMWIWTLLRDRTGLQRQNERLSDALCRSIESGSAERSKLADEYRLGHDWTVRSLLDAFTALVTRRESLGPDTRPPKPKQPTSIAPSEPTPPPLPNAPAPLGSRKQRT